MDANRLQFSDITNFHQLSKIQDQFKKKYLLYQASVPPTKPEPTTTTVKSTTVKQTTESHEETVPAVHDKTTSSGKLICRCIYIAQ